MSMSASYVLVTAAYNEEANIAHLMDSVVCQTRLPKKWVIVSDGSTDNTDRIVQDYAGRYLFIEFIRTEKKRGLVGFASKVQALRVAIDRLRGEEYDFIGNLDADISFQAQYFDSLIKRFVENPKLGITGGYVFDKVGQEVVLRENNGGLYVSGAVQFFRRLCFEATGNYVALPYGGEDTVAVTMARMKGWQVHGVPELTVVHHTHGSSKRGVLREGFREGLMFYTLGSHPLVELVKSIRKLTRKPFLAYGLSRMLGYAWGYLGRIKRPVSDEFVAYFRREQLVRSKSALAKVSARLWQTT